MSAQTVTEQSEACIIALADVLAQKLAEATADADAYRRRVYADGRDGVLRQVGRRDGGRAA